MQRLARFSASLLFLLPAGLFIPAGIARAQGQTQIPPGTTPPTFPQDQAPSATPSPQNQPPEAPLPPDTQAPAQQALSTEQVQQQIQAKLDTEPILKGVQLTVVADDDTVTLRGNVDDEDQHDAALRIAQSYAGDRKIVDKLVVKQHV